MSAVPISHSAPSTIYRKLYKVMSEVDYIQKDKKNAFHGYKYASEAAIKDHLHQALVTHGLLFLPYKSELCERITGLGKDGKESLTVLKLSYRFVDVDSGETFEGELHGVGADSLDKGIYKAITGAIKYILTGTFLIPTGDDPEEEPKPTKAEAKQAQQDVATRKIAEMQAGQSAPAWDWRIALPRFEALEMQYGADAVNNALREEGYSSVEQFPSREIALTVYANVRNRLVEQKHSVAVPEPEKAESEAPTWVDSPHKAIAESSPLQSMYSRMHTFKGRLAIFENLKYQLTQIRGQRDGEEQYYQVLEKHGAQHSNELAKDNARSRNAVKDLWALLQPAEVSA
jgi:hypothetical protein